MSAIFSEDRQHRYTLWREWCPADGSIQKPYAMFIGLNPSTADEVQDDPTIRRCIGFAKLWGYRALCMTNLFAFRATNPKDMASAVDPVGPDNDKWLRASALQAEVIVAAWGKEGAFMKRDIHVINMFADLKCLGTNKDGSPKHPLYLKKDTELIPFSK